MDEVRTVRLDEIWKPRRAADAGDRADLLVPDFAFLDELVVKRENREVAAAGAPRRVIGRRLFFGQSFAIGINGGIGWLSAPKRRV